jgi:hypothetical protein
VRSVTASIPPRISTSLSLAHSFVGEGDTVDTPAHTLRSQAHTTVSIQCTTPSTHLNHSDTSSMPTTPATTQPVAQHRASNKPDLNMADNGSDPSQWLNFSMPPRRHVPGSGQPAGVPRRSRRGEGWRGSALSRERFVQSNFRFVLKPTEVLSYGAHFADPDM